MNKINYERLPWDITKSCTSKLQFLNNKLPPNMIYPAYKVLLKNKLFYIPTNIPCDNCGKRHGQHYSCREEIITTCQPNHCYQKKHRCSICINEYPENKIFNINKSLLMESIIYIGKIIIVNNKILILLDNEKYMDDIKRPYRNFRIRGI